SPTRLVPVIPRDLETIAMVCLRKEPERRYATAEALAEDLRRFQAGEPILARRSGVVNRGWKWTRRNPKLAASLALAISSLLVAMGLSIALAWSQYRAAQRLGIEQAKTLSEKQTAEELYRTARSAIDDFLTEVSADVFDHSSDWNRVRKLGRKAYS